MEMIYLAYRNFKLFAYSFDIRDFFQYLQNFYKAHGVTEITIQKLKFKKSDFESIQFTNPELEIQEYVENVLLTGIEIDYWDRYLRGFYNNTAELIIKEKGTTISRTYEEFLAYLGSEKIQNIVNATNYDSVRWEYEFHKEFLEIISDK